MKDPAGKPESDSVRGDEIPMPEELNRRDSMLLAIIIHDLAAVEEPRDINWVVWRVLGPGAPNPARGLFGASAGASVGGMIGAIIGWTALNTGQRDVNRILRVIPAGVQGGLLDVSGTGGSPLFSATEEGRRWSKERYERLNPSAPPDSSPPDSSDG